MIRKIGYNDIYNIVTKEHFPNVIDNLCVHLELFPTKYATMYQDDPPVVPFLEKTVKDLFEFDLRIGWHTTLRHKFVHWAQQGHIIMFKLKDKGYNGIYFGRLIHVSLENLMRPMHYLVTNEYYRSASLDCKMTEVIKFEIEALSSLEVCEILHKETA